MPLTALDNPSNAVPTPSPKDSQPSQVWGEVIPEVVKSPTTKAPGGHRGKATTEENSAAPPDTANSRTSVPQRTGRRTR